MRKVVELVIMSGDLEEETAEENDSMLCKRVVTKDRRYITQITCYEKGSLDLENLKEKQKNTLGGGLKTL